MAEELGAHDNNTSYVADDEDTSTVYESITEQSIHFPDDELKFECAHCSSDVIGYCDGCRIYLCQKCLQHHLKYPPYRGSHKIYNFHCSESLKVKKVVRATSFCLECEEYLCGKCSVLHTGFRKWRHHNIVQGTRMPFVDTKRRSKSIYTQLSTDSRTQKCNASRNAVSRKSGTATSKSLGKFEPTWYGYKLKVNK